MPKNRKSHCVLYVSVCFPNIFVDIKNLINSNKKKKKKRKEEAEATNWILHQITMDMKTWPAQMGLSTHSVILLYFGAPANIDSINFLNLFSKLSKHEWVNTLTAVTHSQIEKESKWKRYNDIYTIDVIDNLLNPYWSVIVAFWVVIYAYILV